MNLDHLTEEDMKLYESATRSNPLIVCFQLAERLSAARAELADSAHQLLDWEIRATDAEQRIAELERQLSLSYLPIERAKKTLVAADLMDEGDALDWGIHNLLDTQWKSAAMKQQQRAETADRQLTEARRDTERLDKYERHSALIERGTNTGKWFAWTERERLEECDSLRAAIDAAKGENK